MLCVLLKSVSVTSQYQSLLYCIGKVIRPQPDYLSTHQKATTPTVTLSYISWHISWQYTSFLQLPRKISEEMSKNLN